MSTISIIGAGGMAKAIAGRITQAKHTLEVMSRDSVKAQGLAKQLSGAKAGNYGAVPTGDIVIIAVPYSGVAGVLSDFGDALSGKIIIDIANPVNAIWSRSRQGRSTRCVFRWRRQKC